MKYQHLTVEEREEVERGLWRKESLRSIAKRLGRSHSSLARETRRNKSPVKSTYTPRLAHERALKQRKSRGRVERLKNERIRSYVVRHLKKRWSPEQIAGRIRIDLKERVSRVTQEPTNRSKKRERRKKRDSSSSPTSRKKPGPRPSKWSRRDSKTFQTTPSTPSRSTADRRTATGKVLKRPPACGAFPRTRTTHGSGAPTRTPTASSVITVRRRPISRSCRMRRLPQWSML